MDLRVNLELIKGFLDPEEGRALYEQARSVAHVGPCLEIGSYCGKSTVYLGAACRETGNTLFAIDHHRGSEEHQVGEAYHDAALYDEARKQVDTFGVFRQTMALAELETTVVPIVAPSTVVGRHWQTPLGLVFIDGGHSASAAHSDYETWAPHVQIGGLLLIHDVFPDPADGGRPPFEIFERALAEGPFVQVAMVKTLAILQRIT